MYICKHVGVLVKQRNKLAWVKKIQNAKSKQICYNRTHTHK